MMGAVVAIAGAVYIADKVFALSVNFGNVWRKAYKDRRELPSRAAPSLS